MKAVAYARFSSDNQREESIEAQIFAIEEYAKQKGITILKTYKDEALSGTTDKRPGFQRMIKDAASGDFTLVLVHKGNRFARNRMESALHKHTLQKYGIKVIAVAEDFGQGHHAVLMESVLEGLAEFYSLELAAETMKGLMVNAKKCLYNGGRVLYGFKVNKERKYEIEPEEAKIVNEIFKRVAGGWSYGKIIADLNERGIARRGRRWNKNTIHDMLKNERYAGVYIFNETPRKIKNKRNSRIKNSKDEMIRIPGGMPVIVNRKVFDRVQKKLGDRRRPRQKTKKNFYLLTGLLECGECGAAYVGSNSYRDKKEYLWYACSGKKRRGGCNNRNIRKEVLEDAAIKYITDQAKELDPEEFAREYNEYLDSYAEGASERISEIKKELAEIAKKVDFLLDAIEAGADVKERLKVHSERKQRLQDALVRAERERQQHRVTPDQVKQLIDMFDPSKAETEQGKREALHRLIKKIVINNNSRGDASIDMCTVWDGSDMVHVTSPTPPLSELLELLKEKALI